MTLHRFLDHTGGVLALVALTATVVWGLIAADRLVLAARDRLFAQAVHRAIAMCALGFLAVHIGIKTAEAHARPAAALLPFSSGPWGADGLIGLGALAGYLMVLAATTGAVRSVFAGRGRAAHHWRALHACAYPAWCAAVLHGLKSGRPPTGWVTACYALCLAAVAAALAFRVLRGRRRTLAAPAVGGAHAAARELPLPAPRPVRALLGRAPGLAPHGAPGRHL